MKTAIVTGANGFVGSAVTRELLMCGYRVYAVGRRGSFSNILRNKNVIFVTCDLAELELLPERLPKQEQENICQGGFHPKDEIPPINKDL